jgi:hypothetical protein
MLLSRPHISLLLKGVASAGVKTIMRRLIKYYRKEYSRWCSKFLNKIPVSIKKTILEGDVT